VPSAEICVVFNPAAGKQRAAKRLQTLERHWGNRVHWRPTDAAGHAVELARQAAIEGYSIVAAAGGDGTVHEVANGLLLAGNRDVRFAVIPIGSANDYAHSLEHAFPPNSESDVHAVDVGLVREPGGRQRYFVCCLGLGFNGMVTLESRRIRRLQGVALYGLATLRALWYHYGTPRMEITFDEEPPRQLRTLMMSVLVGRREGSFVMAPDAKLDDGLLDYAHAGDLTRWEVLRLLPRLALAGPPTAHAKVRLGRCRRIHLRSESPLAVHTDGEFFCRPDENIRELEMHIMPAALHVQLGL
jgi:diacylglycerol kinase family enzyme